jgi:glycosyltransferase involved in cell wall biosynthesis
MNVLLDATALMHGGGVQVGLALLSNAATHGTQWHAVLSANLARECPAEVLEAMASVRTVPTAGRSRFWHAQRLLISAYRQCKPDVTFAVFGPAYWVPPGPHIQGFARGHMIYPEVLNRYPNCGRLRIRLHNAKDRFAVSRGDRFIAESRTVRERLSRIAGIAPDRIAIIANTYSPFFLGCLRSQVPKPPRATKLIAVPAAHYTHKNLEIVPHVAARLQALLSIPFRFLLTIPPSGRGWRAIAEEAARLGVQDSVRTLGVVPHARIARLYSLSDSVFLPTWLESSTATYPESFAAEVPLITSDLDFARELCGDAALFVDPFDPAAAAEAIARVLTDTELAQSLIERGRAALAANYVSPEEKWRRQLLALEAVAQGNPFPDELM